MGVSAVEDCHFSPVFLTDPCEDFVPIRPSGICSGLQPCQQVLVLLLVKDVEGHLQGNCLHVGPLQGGGDVHVHLQEVAHLPALLSLLRLQLREQTDEPLKTLLLSVDPDEVNLSQVEHARVDLTRPAVVAIGTRPFDLQVSVDD